MQTLPLQTDAAAAAAAAGGDRLRVMIVDDSMLIRSIVGGWLRGAADLEVVATHPNGRRAVDDLAKSRPDVVVLDLEMPEMDGLTALPLILERAPGTVVLVASSLTRRGAEVSLRALTLGAADYLAKPEAVQGQAGAEPFRDELLAKIRALGRRSRVAPVARTRERKAATAVPGRDGRGHARRSSCGPTIPGRCRRSSSAVRPAARRPSTSCSRPSVRRSATCRCSSPSTCRRRSRRSSPSTSPARPIVRPPRGSTASRSGPVTSTSPRVGVT